MYCRHCGAELEEDAKFCIRCGAPVACDGERPVSCSDPGSCGSGCSCGCPAGGNCTRRNSIFIIIAALLLVGVFVTGYVLMDDTDEPEPEQTLGDITVRGGLVTDIVEMTDGGISYTGEGVPTWEYRDVSQPYLERTASGSYVHLQYDRGEGSLLEPTPGFYEVRLYVDGVRAAEGTLIVDGVLTKEYSWTFPDGNTFLPIDVKYSYRFSDFQKYFEADAIRNMFPDSNARFVVQDESTDALLRALEGAYTDAFGPYADLHGQMYANFLLSFVQYCIDYPDMVDPDTMTGDPENGNGDYFLRGIPEYWAYPMETIHLGMGDCEDTSFLMCTLFSAAGYDSALAILPEHVLVGVELESFEKLSGTVLDDRLYYKKMAGHELNLYFCETAVENIYPVGYVTEYDIEHLDSVTSVTPVPAAERGLPDAIQ